jgi:ATP-dependent DNA ligase
MAQRLDIEGIVVKDGPSIYQAGRATRWQKIKTEIGTERERQRQSE